MMVNAQVALNHFEIVENLEEAAAMIFEKIAICEFYHAIYIELSSTQTSEQLSRTISQGVKNMLEAALPKLYASILCFLIKARHYFDPKSS